MAQEQESNPPMTVREMAALGGNARAKGLTKKRRKEIAQKAAQARWGDKTVTVTATRPKAE